MAGKEAIFVILDVGKSMKKNYLDTQETRLNFGIESIRQLINQKLLFNVKRDQIGIILMGREGEEAENINIYSELDFPSIDLLHQLNSIEAEDEEDNGDIFLSIDFAIYEFIAKYKKLKWGKKDATEDEKNVSLKRACAYDFVTKKKHLNCNQSK